VRFPWQEVVLFERRHQAVGVHGEIGGLLVLAEGAADVDALVRQLELADRPHHLLHVDRGIASPDLDHGFASCERHGPPTGAGDVALEHVRVAKVIVKNRPETMKPGRRLLSAANGCVQPRAWRRSRRSTKSPGTASRPGSLAQLW